MILLDLLAKYGPYAFVLMGLWFSAAFVAAAWRVRHFRSRKCVLSLLGDALSCLLYPALVLFQMSYLNRFSSDWTQVLWYFTILIYMCIPALAFAYTRRHKNMPTWRQAGYRYLIDVLFFRPPFTTEPVEAAPPSEKEHRVNRLTYLLVLDIAALSIVFIFLSDSLRPCAWLDTSTGRSGCVREVKPDGVSADVIEFSPDGSSLAIQGNFKTPLQLYRLEDGAQLWIAADNEGYLGSLSFSPDGKRLANTGTDDKVRIWDWRTGQLHKELPTRADTVRFSPDGQYLATGEEKTGIQLWRVNDWTMQQTLPALGDVMSFSPDGKLIVSEGISRSLTIWKIEDGTVFKTLPGNGYVPSFIAYSPDGMKLASSSLRNSIQIWNIADSSLALTLPISRTKGMAFSPDGRYLLVADWRYPESPQDVLTFWRVSDGQLMLKMVENEGFISDIDSVAFSPDGKFFAYGTWEKLKIFRMPDGLY